TARTRGRDLPGRSRPTITATRLPHPAACPKACVCLPEWRPIPPTAKIMDMPAYESHNVFAVLSHPSAITPARHATTAQGLPHVHGGHAHACGPACPTAPQTRT